jgi:flagellar export protein FliJ
VRRFEFRLQRVLQWQQKLCRVEEDKFRLCQSNLAEAEQKLVRLADERRAIEQEFSSHPNLSLVDLRALAAFRQKSVTDEQAFRRERENRGQALDAQRQRLIAARRRLELIEKLRERALDEYTRAADRELEALSHESYISTWLSRR